MKAPATLKTPATQNPSPTQHKGPRLTSILLSCLLLSSAPAFASVAPFEPVTINPGSALRQAPGVIVTTDMSELARFRQTFGDAKLDQVDYSDLQKLNQLQDLVRGCEAELAEVHHNYEHYRQAQEPGLLNSIWKTLNLAKSDYDKKQRYETVTRLIEQLAGSSAASEILTDHYGRDSFVRTFSQETGLTSPKVQLLRQSRQAGAQAIEEPGFLSRTNLFFHWLSDQLPIGPQGVSARLNRGYGKNSYKPQAESNPFFDAKPNAKVEPLHLGYGDSWHKQKSKQAKLKKLMAKLVHKPHHPNHKPHPHSNWHTPNKPWQYWHNPYHHHHHHHNHTNSTGPVLGGAGPGAGGLGISDNELKSIITAQITEDGIKIYNVGQGQGVTVESLFEGKKYNWIIDAGSTMNPYWLQGSAGKVPSSESFAGLATADPKGTEEVVNRMEQIFCPLSKNYKGIVFISSPDKDHNNLIEGILDKCFVKFNGPHFKPSDNGLREYLKERIIRDVLFYRNTGSRAIEDYIQYYQEWKVIEKDEYCYIPSAVSKEIDSKILDLGEKIKEYDKDSPGCRSRKKVKFEGDEKYSTPVMLYSDYFDYKSYLLNRSDGLQNIILKTIEYLEYQINDIIEGISGCEGDAPKHLQARLIFFKNELYKSQKEMEKEFSKCNSLAVELITKNVDKRLTAIGITTDVEAKNFLEVNYRAQNIKDIVKDYYKYKFAEEYIRWIAPEVYSEPGAMPSPIINYYINISGVEKYNYKIAEFLNKNNRINIYKFIETQRNQDDFYIMNNPSYPPSRETGNINTLMIRLRNKDQNFFSDKNSVFILGDSELVGFVETFYLKNMENLKNNKIPAKSIIGAHHGSKEKGSHLIARFFDMDEIYFSAGFYSTYMHPTEEAVSLAKEVLAETNKHFIYYGKRDKGQDLWVFEQTSKKIFVTAGFDKNLKYHAI